MGKRLIPPDPAEIHEVMLRDALEERYLAYALSTITQRALPDARDGLKPVHRRILYGMRLLRLDPGGAYKKSAKVVGDVMGSFHPHGDQSIYDALVRLAQCDFLHPIRIRGNHFLVHDGKGLTRLWGANKRGMALTNKEFSLLREGERGRREALG